MLRLEYNMKKSSYYWYMVTAQEMKPCQIEINRVTLEKQNIKKVKGNKDQGRVIRRKLEKH